MKVVCHLDSHFFTRGWVFRAKGKPVVRRGRQCPVEVTVGSVPCLVRSSGVADRQQVHPGYPVLDACLESAAGCARWNTMLATAFDGGGLS
jgi:hypothetical protein